MKKESIYSFKRLIFLLALSGGLNILLLSFIFYWMAIETPPIPYCELKPASQAEKASPLFLNCSNDAVIRAFRNLSSHQLMRKLSSSFPVENGYAERDLALACLVSFHHFDLARPLASFHEVLQRRTISYGKKHGGAPAEITLFPHLSDAHFSAIVQFAKTERYPYTPEGLFLLLQRKEVDARLNRAFFLTPEFMAIETLLHRSGVEVGKEEILNMLLQGEWSMLENFAAQQRIAQDLSCEQRQKCLLSYLRKGASTAASLLVQTDPIFAVKKLDDADALAVLSFLEGDKSLVQPYAEKLLENPRSDAVWQKASACLESHGVEEPKACLPKAEDFVAKECSAEQRIVSESTVVKKLAVATSSASAFASPKKDSLYMIQTGDSLWKISRRFNVDIEQLRKYNQLHSDALRPGSILRIPF